MEKHYLISVLGVFIGGAMFFSSGYAPPIHGDTVHDSKVTLHMVQGTTPLSSSKDIQSVEQKLPKTGESFGNIKHIEILFILMGLTLEILSLTIMLSKNKIYK